MTDFQDHFEDMDEEINEFSEDFSERLEDLFGFEVEIDRVEQQQQAGRFLVKVDPVGAEEVLSEELETDVDCTGLNFYIDTS